jgi:AcrR family transcriptional regulator
MGRPRQTFVDVARALGVSHGSVYRHFPSKAPLRDAVTERWLKSISSELESVTVGQRLAAERLQRWLDLLVHSKRSKALDEPELFDTYIELAAESREVVNAHVDTLLAQLARIISDGVAHGEFEATDPAATARAVSTPRRAFTTRLTRPIGPAPAPIPRTNT